MALYFLPLLFQQNFLFNMTIAMGICSLWSIDNIVIGHQRTVMIPGIIGIRFFFYPSVYKFVYSFIGKELSEKHSFFGQMLLLL